MGTLNLSQPGLMQSIRRFRDNLIDADVALDDADRVVAAALEDRERARHERNRIACHLQHLVDLHDEIESVAIAFGPEIAVRHMVATLEATV